MIRNSLLCLLALLVGFVAIAIAEKPATEKPLQGKEFIEKFLDSLRSKAHIDDADSCPGGTKADRESPQAVDTHEEVCGDESCGGHEKVQQVVGETDQTDGSDEGEEGAPKTLPSGIQAAPIAPGKREKLEKPKAEDVKVVGKEPPLTPELEALKLKLRDTLAWYYDHPQRVTDRSPWGIMHWMLPFGVDSQVIDANGRRQNAVGYLCYNYPCKGQQLFYLKNGQIAGDIGPGLQGHRGQFLSMLAQSKVDPAYPMRIEGREFKVADLIEYEKRTCESGTELTFKLIALSHYLKHDDKWKNFKGEDWDIPRLIREELKAPIIGAACGGTHRMTGFSYAVRKHEQRALIFGDLDQWSRARKFIDDYHKYTFSLQNRDGSFSTNWFAPPRAELNDPARRLQTSGHILEWMVYSLPKDELQEKDIVRAVDYVTTLLDQGRSSKWEIGPLGHGLHALCLYDERVFGGRPGIRAEQLARKPRVELK